MNLELDLGDHLHSEILENGIEDVGLDVYENGICLTTSVIVLTLTANQASELKTLLDLYNF